MSHEDQAHLTHEVVLNQDWDYYKAGARIRVTRVVHDDLIKYKIASPVGGSLMPKAKMAPARSKQITETAEIK